MGWATLWAIFPRSHPVTLFVCDTETKKVNDHFLRFVYLFNRPLDQCEGQGCQIVYS
jgi:hypothetical protein